MAQTSIHFQGVQGGSEEHNRRLKKLDYVHHELSSQNDYWQSDTQEARLAFVTQNAKAKTGRKMQAKATPIREAVVVISQETTMDDLKNLSKRLNDRFGIDVFQIAIHKDEGYKKSKDGIKLNLHAHLVADWTDHQSGKSLKLNRNDMAEMQTICAEVLGMERGKSSDKKHLTAMQFKEQKAKEEAEVAINRKKLADKFTDVRLDELKRVSTSLQEKRNELADVTNECKEQAEKVVSLRSEAETERKSRDILHDTKNRLRGEIFDLNKEKSRLSSSRDELQSEAESLADDVQAARDDLHGLQSRKQELENEILMRHHEKAQAEAEANAAKAKAEEAKKEAAKGLMVGGAKKLGNLLGLGAEAKQLKELPQQLTAAKAEGEKAAVTKILDVARLNFGGKEVTPEMIGKAWRSKWDEAKNARAETERQVKNANARASGLEKILDAFLAIPIIRACIYAIVSFVRQGSRSFNAEDTANLRAVLGGDPDNAALLKKIAYYNGGAYAQPHLSSYWDRAEMCMQKIARGENQEQNQEQSQGRGWHL